ncbi:ER-associated proteolytic system protein Der1 [Saitoella complicata NRRL Y-17804]|uniref:ER-associated proteolytic system protein Der1 n=1 Tax=Saitoella complicata (strain BCRC 22490 / CBS 7301 / JCM 7358 / NBRC 10748 / NRRL Y-17804) TaxID=698492 RepID=UPI00086797E9|nr:ER-associated proteolytic system protein Der1 [Saitoella complicata NRRL Y-17804]ODQ51847.1 ER-associated proteolytic system protein Der1 [Saitoella complicata NRRL Y-17804]
MPFDDIPAVTKYYVAGAILCSLAVQCDLVTPYKLFFSWHTVWGKQQYWRLITTFIFYGPLSLDFLFHIFFMARYSRMLEESLPNSTPDFAFLLLFSSLSLLFLGGMVGIPFLAGSLSFVLVYIWSRRNTGVRLSFLGLFVFRAPWLPWVLLAFSFILNNSLPRGDLIGIAVGHVYYFLQDVWPEQEASGGVRVLGTPVWFARLFEGRQRQE